MDSTCSPRKLASMKSDICNGRRIFHNLMPIAVLYIWLTYMVVVVLVRDLVEVQESLVHGLLQSQGGLHGVQTSSPLVLVGPLDVLENDPSSTLGLVLHELLGVFELLLGGVTEELGEPLQIHVVTLEVEGLYTGNNRKFKRTVQ